MSPKHLGDDHEISLSYVLIRVAVATHETSRGRHQEGVTISEVDHDNCQAVQA